MTSVGPAPDSDGWRRLDQRMIWVDLGQAVLSLIPLAVSTGLGGGPVSDGLWGVFAIAVAGVGGAVVDIHRWIFTRYRITDELVERRTGVLFRGYRSLRRDRVRSVDIQARLRHRIGGLRLVEIGAGQQAAAGESALALDAVSVADAHALRALLLDRRAEQGPAAPTPAHAGGPPVAPDPHAPPVWNQGWAPDWSAPPAPADGSAPPAPAWGPDGASDAPGAWAPPGAAPAPAWQPFGPPEQVLARLDPRWVIHNVVSAGALAAAGGLLWGAYWLALNLGIDADQVVDDVADQRSVGTGVAVAIGLLLMSVLGAGVLAVTFFVEQWGFVLARVADDDGGTVLRTRHGLFTTREIDRDEARTRGVQISEPLAGRWLGVADTEIVTTGLKQPGVSRAAAILPRGPVSAHRQVAAEVLPGGADALATPLRPHARRALQRRVGRALLSTAVVAAVIGWLVVGGVAPPTTWALAVVFAPVALAAAWIDHRALGHAVTGEHVVVRSGLSARVTTVLRRDAVSTVAIRETLFQRRLGLQTVALMTSAGTGAYEAIDVDRDEATAFALHAAPGLLDPFLADGAPADQAPL